MPNDEITTREALDILGLAHPSSITHLVAEHKLKPSRRMPGKRGAYLFRRAHIERLRDERNAASGAAMTVACAEVTRYLGAAAPSPVLEDQ